MQWCEGCKYICYVCSQLQVSLLEHGTQKSTNNLYQILQNNFNFPKRCVYFNKTLHFEAFMYNIPLSLQYKLILNAPVLRQRSVTLHWLQHLQISVRYALRFHAAELHIV